MSESEPARGDATDRHGLAGTPRAALRADLRQPGVVAGSIWLTVWLVAALTGERFSTTYLREGWQLVPWDVLSSEPVRSVWYLHIQPPGWNLALGLVGWTTPASEAITLQLLMASLGVAGAALAAVLASRLGLGSVAAPVVAVVATIHPEVLLLASEPTYELPVAVLLLAMAVAATYADARPGRALVAAVATATAVVLTRSLFHPVWLVGVVAVALIATRRRTSTGAVVVAIVVPLVLVGGWLVKNQLLFGTATTSSWTGMNVQRSVVPIVDRHDLARLEANGDVSPIAAIAPFSPYDRYAPFMAPCNADHDHASVATSGGGSVATNFNFECFLPVFDQAGADAWAVIRAHPGDYASGRWWSLRQTFVIGPDGPSSESGFVRMLDRVYSIVRVDVVVPSWSEGWGDEAYAALFGGESDLGLMPLVLYPVVIVSGCHRGWRAVRGTSSRLGPDLAWALAAITVSWTVAAGVFGELGEQARFRAMVDPITWVLAGVVLVPWLVGTVGPWISANFRTSSSERTERATVLEESRPRSPG